MSVKCYVEVGEKREAIYRRNSKGPRMDPCGTPEVTGNQLVELVPSHVVLWFLLVR